MSRLLRTTAYVLRAVRRFKNSSKIVQEAHDRVMHNGVKETLTEIRTKFWIVKGRILVRSVIYHCVVCRRFEGPACCAPPPPPLPKFRLREEPPFSFTGVDFAGPLYLRSFGLTAASKVWICFFTCCVTRAVHLDIVTDMSTETFMRCLSTLPRGGGYHASLYLITGKHSRLLQGSSRLCLKTI